MVNNIAPDKPQYSRKMLRNIQSYFYQGNPHIWFHLTYIKNYRNINKAYVNWPFLVSQKKHVLMISYILLTFWSQPAPDHNAQIEDLLPATHLTNRGTNRKDHRRLTVREKTPGINFSINASCFLCFCSVFHVRAVFFSMKPHHINICAQLYD